MLNHTHKHTSTHNKMAGSMLTTFSRHQCHSKRNRMYGGGKLQIRDEVQKPCKTEEKIHCERGKDKMYK